MFFDERNEKNSRENTNPLNSVMKEYLSYCVKMLRMMIFLSVACRYYYLNTEDN